MEKNPEVIATTIVDSAFKVHSTLGPGLLESAYQQCLTYELRTRGFTVECESPVPIRYRDVTVDAGYRLDMLVNGLVMVENKTVQAILPIHEAQILTYMRLRDIHLGFVINWYVKLIKHGIKRMVNDYHG